MAESDAVAAGDSLRIAGQVNWAVEAAARALPWHPVCLPQAIAATAMLRRRSINSTLYLGVDPADRLDAHAWVRVGPVIVTGGPTIDRFTVVSTFA
jgi:Transglutaminase-like superfamily